MAKGSIVVLCEGWAEGPASLEKKRLREPESHVKSAMWKRSEIYSTPAKRVDRYRTFGGKPQETD